MINQHPIYAFVLSILVAGIIIKQCIIKGKILKRRLIFSFFLIFINAFFLFFYADIKVDELYLKICNYSLLAINIIIGIMFFTSINASMSSQSFVKEFINSLDKNKIFVLIDKKDRIKEISFQLARELLTEKENIIKKRFLNVIDEAWNIIELNGIETNNNEIKKYYKEYPASSTANIHEKRELIINKKNGETIVLNLMEIPIYSGNRYSGRLLIGDKKSTDTLLSIEKELVDKHAELEGIRLRFISALEIGTEAIFFRNLDNNSIWGNDLFVSKLKLDDNSILTEEYFKLIHPDDLAHYLAVLGELTVNVPTYEVTYRFYFGGCYKYVSEKGKRIFENKSNNEILGFIDVVNTDHYERSNIKELDNILSTDDLLVKATKLYEQNKTFEVVTFRLDNIPQINEEHGRNVGNMLISRYVEMIRDNLISETDDIFRVGGLEFSFIIVDFRSMDRLKKALHQEEKILHPKTQIGAANVALEVFMGIALSSDVKKAEELIMASDKALRFARKPQYKANYAFYKDII